MSREAKSHGTPSGMPESWGTILAPFATATFGGGAAASGYGIRAA